MENPRKILNGRAGKRRKYKQRFREDIPEVSGHPMGPNKFKKMQADWKLQKK